VQEVFLHHKTKYNLDEILAEIGEDAAMNNPDPHQQQHADIGQEAITALFSVRHDACDTQKTPRNDDS